jgi:hypothetical protein
LTDKGGILLWGDTPFFLLLRFKFVFLAPFTKGQK